LIDNRICNDQSIETSANPQTSGDRTTNQIHGLMIQIGVTRAQRPACSCGTRIECASKQIELFDVAFDLDGTTADQEPIDLERIE
jgi:hypothetical protein